MSTAFTEEQLTAPLTLRMLRAAEDPAALINARIDHVERPTPARKHSSIDGSSQPLNGAELASVEGALAMHARLQTAVGYSGPRPQQLELGGGPYRVLWNGEERRCWMIGPLNVGLLLRRYANTIDEIADAMTRMELASYRADEEEQ